MLRQHVAVSFPRKQGSLFGLCSVRARFGHLETALSLAESLTQDHRD